MKIGLFGGGNVGAALGAGWASATLMLCGRDGHLLAMGELHRAGL